MRRKKKAKRRTVVPYELAESFCGLLGEDVYKGTKPRIKRPLEGDTLIFEDISTTLSIDKHGGFISIDGTYTYIPAPENDTEQGMFKGMPKTGDVHIEKRLE